MGSIVFVGMDVHKATIAVAVAEGVRGGEVRQLGIFPNRAEVIAKLAGRLAGDGRELSFCYEAGPCGYGLQRQLEGLGHACVVVAPSLIPSKPGDRVKTDRRDALSLAKLHRAGELTAVWVPDAAHEAMRDLVRARATAVRVLGKARQHLQGFLLRHGRIYAGRTTWTLAHRRWLTTLRFQHPAQQIVLQDYIHAIQDAEQRVARLAEQITALLPSWSLAPVVRALQAMRGVAQIVAVTVAAEVGDFSRFANPRQLMAYLGLVPSERSSGGTVRRGGITKAGNALARRVLIEGAWTYRMQARVSRKLHDRIEQLPSTIRDIAWKAQLRLCGRYRHLIAAGKARVVARNDVRPDARFGGVSGARSVRLGRAVDAGSVRLKRIVGETDARSRRFGADLKIRIRPAGQPRASGR